MKLLVIFTCHNRREKTEKCIKILSKGNPICEFTFIIVDDNSIDGTKEAIEELKKDYTIHFLQGNGKLFYSGGMHMGMTYALNILQDDFDYLLMINDDVEFFDHGIEAMIAQSREQKDSVIVGATKDCEGRISYSAIKYIKNIKYRKVFPEEWKLNADTFNANCVLIPYHNFKCAGVIDSYYVHSLGDFDYGLRLKKSGCRIHVAKKYIGICNANSYQNSWMNTSLNRKDRIRIKESIKGSPTRQWFYFLKKNFGLFTALKGCITPYIRILIGK